MDTKLFRASSILLLALMSTSAHAAAPIDFNRDVRPIFSKNCTACHGGVKAAGGLSFVYRDKVVLAKGKSGEIVVAPGDPAGSELVRRITSHDPDQIMPKPGKGREALSAKDIATLTNWIKAGAPWAEHWAFVPPTEPARPVVKTAGWAKTRGDEFVLARLEAEGLAPSAPAAPAEWLRRVSLDLIGLPPTLEEFSAYQKDAEKDPKAAREHVVDRLLASPRFGERWASMWLDLARYADTYGFEKDPNRDIWPWRDWVIRAFNADMSFDQFTIKQLAGDLLEHPTGDDMLATAFHRNTQNNTEGGTNDEEWRTAAVLDRVNTTWTTWQATTFGCVQCHAHPYDPFPHDDYYRFVAFFDNSEDCDLNDDFPKFVVPADPAKRDEAARSTVQLRKLREDLNDSGVKLAAKVSDFKPLIPSSAKTSSGTLTIGAGGVVQAGGTLNIGVSYTVDLPVFKNIAALRLTIHPDSEDPRKWPERGSVLSHLQATLVSADGKREPVKLREAIADYIAGSLDPEGVVGGGGGFGGYPSLSGTRWCIVLLDQPLAADSSADHLELVMKQGAVADGGAQGCPIRKFDWAASADPRWAAFLNDPSRKQIREQMAELRRSLGNITGTRVPVMEERCLAGTRDTRVFIRGNRLTKDQSVLPGMPDIVHPPKKSGRLTRLDLARWMVSDDNPLTARVLANRLWAEMYGHGIVETLEDFGTSGSRPTHPELLDHLALRLSHDDHWSIKTFLREIALSATYGQTSRASAAIAQADPQNALLSHGPRVRLTAEMVRDQALAISGLLSTKEFGPPVYPPQPAGVWRSVYSGASWKTSTGEDRYRRAVYTYCKRTAGYPGYLTFDAPTRDACSARRIPTNTPLQALVTLNDPAFIEMAQSLAKRMDSFGGQPREQISHGCQLILLSDPPPKMVNTLMGLYEDAVKEYTADPTLAKELVDRPESAAMVLVANTLLNLDVAMSR